MEDFKDVKSGYSITFVSHFSPLAFTVFSSSQCLPDLICIEYNGCSTWSNGLHTSCMDLPFFVSFTVRTSVQILISKTQGLQRPSLSLTKELPKSVLHQLSGKRKQ